MSPINLSVPTAAAPRRWTLPAGPALAGVATTFTSLYLAAGALTPLLVVYKEQWNFPASMLTLVFAVYAVGFLAALLTLGSLSDHIGRRPVLIGALIVQLVSNVIFFAAHDVAWVIVGRVVQGIGTGAATSALTALLVEIAAPGRKKLGTILGSISVTGGLALGSLLAGLAIQLTDAADSIVFTVLIVVTAFGLVIVALSPESLTRAPGALRSLVPRIAIPLPARTEFMAAAPVVAAVWMLAGLSGGLAPSMIHSVFDIDSGLVNGVSGFIAPATSTVAGLALGRVAPRRAMTAGTAAAILGPVGIIAGAVLGNLLLMCAGQAVAGVAFGAAFTASLRLVFPRAPEHERAAVVAALYLVSYLAFGIPIVIAGQLTAPLGVVPTVSLYAAVTVVLAVISLIAQFRLAFDPGSRAPLPDGTWRPPSGRGEMPGETEGLDGAHDVARCSTLRIR